MVPASKLGYPAWSHHESVLRCLDPAWCLFSVPGQRVQSSALATEQFLVACGSEDLGGDLQLRQTYLCPSQAGNNAQPEPDSCGSIPLNIDRVFGEILECHSRP